MPGAIDRAWIEAHAGSIATGHIDCSDRAITSRVVVDKRTGLPIGLTFSDVFWRNKRCNGEKAGTSERQWIADGVEGAFASLDEALAALARRRASLSVPA